jgi:hypothetical protein
MDDLVSAHGGVRGMQTLPIVLSPADWIDRPPETVGADGVHHCLRRYALREEDDGRQDPDGRSGAAAYPSVSTLEHDCPRGRPRPAGEVEMPPPPRGGAVPGPVRR